MKLDLHLGMSACRLSPAELASQVQGDSSGAIIIDVRPRNQYEMAHLRGRQQHLLPTCSCQLQSQDAALKPEMAVLRGSCSISNW